MKHLFGLALAVLYGFGAVPSFAACGTKAPPATITTLCQLQNIGLNATTLAGSYTLGNDIDATGFAFKPIGSFTQQFYGTFDGKDFAIRNLTITLPSQNDVGLFGVLTSGAAIKNVHLTNIRITGAGSVGGIGGANYGLVTNVTVSGSISASQTAGGVVGSNVASSSGGVTHSYSAASVSADAFAGGLVGQNSGGTIRESYATGAVNGGNYVGGLAGLSSPNSGPSGGMLENVYAWGIVTGTGSYVGGLIGSAGLASISGAYATGAVTGASGVGGLIGSQSNSVINSAYWDTETTGQSKSAGATSCLRSTYCGETTATLQSGTLPTGFDPTVWIATQGQYPKLQWQGDFLISFPLQCGSPIDLQGRCEVPYTLGAYTPLRINSVFDHSLKRGSGGSWQYGTTGKKNNGDGKIVGFTGETAKGDAQNGDVTCIKGTITLNGLTNDSGCNSTKHVSYDEHPGYDYDARCKKDRQNRCVAETGAPVLAVADGVVINNGGERCYKTYLYPDACDSWGWLGIDHQNGYITQYGHLSVINVALGVRVIKGQEIGQSGNTIPATREKVGPHLHFEVLKFIDNELMFVDPYGWTDTMKEDPLYCPKGNGSPCLPNRPTPRKLWE